MSTIFVWLIAAAVLLVLGGGVYLYFRFGKGSSAVKSILGVGGSVVKGIANMLPDDVDELDAHDIVLVVGRLLEAVPQWAADPTNETFDDCKEEILAFIEAQRAVVPQLDKLPKETLEKVAASLFGLAQALINMGKDEPAPVAPDAE
jgi:hypothetical protein